MSASHTLPLDMLNAGAQLANIAFNLKQRVGHVISTHDAELLDRCHRQWDATLASTAAEPAALSSQAPAALHETDIYDFAGWLTTRPGVMPVGSTSEAGPMADAVGEYIKTYPERFAALQSRQPAAPVAPVAPVAAVLASPAPPVQPAEITDAMVLAAIKAADFYVTPESIKDMRAALTAAQAEGGQ